MQHLPSYLGFSYLGRGVSLHGCSSKTQPLLLTFDEGYLLTSAFPDLLHGIAPLGPPVPTQPLLLGSGVAPLNREGEKVKVVTDFLFLGSKITANGDCSHEIRRQLLLGRNVMTNLDSVLKSKDITLSTKVRIVKAVVFPVVTYSCDSWTIKKAAPKN